MLSKKSKNNSPVYSQEPPKKTMLQKVMKPKDWLMLGILIVVSVVCWTWVWRAYQEPFVNDVFLINLESNSESNS